MVKVFLLSTIAAALLGAAHALDANQTISELTEGKIIPTVFDEFEPTADLKILYNEDIEIENGLTIAADSLEEAPQVFFKASNTSEYTFLLVNIDAKEPQEHLQWLKTNINAGQNDGVDVTAYKSPLQPLGGSPQRLVYALFKQPIKNITTASLNSSHIQDDLKQFVKDNNLTLINAAYIYTQNQTTMFTDRLNRISNSFKEGGLLDSLVGTVDGLLDEVEALLGLDLGLGSNKKKNKKKNNGKKSNSTNTDISEEDDDDEDDEDDGILNIHIGLGNQPDRTAVIGQRRSRHARLN